MNYVSHNLLFITIKIVSFSLKNASILSPVFTAKKDNFLLNFIKKRCF